MNIQNMPRVKRKLLKFYILHFKHFTLISVSIILVACTGCQLISDILSDPREFETNGFFDLAWSADGDYLAVGGGKGIFLFDSDLQLVNRVTPTFHGNEESIYSVTWHPNKNIVAGASNNGTIVFFHSDQSRIEHLIIESSFVAWSPSGEKFITAGIRNISINDFPMQIWSIDQTSLNSISVKAIETLNGHTGLIDTSLWSPDGSLIASESDMDGTIRIWNSETGEQFHILTHPANQQVGAWISISWSPDSKMLASSNSDGLIRIWNVVNGDTITSFSEGSDFGALSIMWSPNGKQLVTTNGDSVKIWDATTGQLVNTLQAQHRSINQVSWSPHGSKIVAIGTIQERSRATIWLWDASTGELLATAH